MIGKYVLIGTLLILGSLPSFTEIEDTAQLPLLNPDCRERKTAKLQLENGLSVLLISDPTVEQSAAAVSVKVGSWNDPLEYPGMAHFCEHMLFMGSEKYPNENAFFSEIADYAGKTNAFTAPNKTVYMFSCETSGFLQILDRFSHFFIDPLFNPKFVSKELHNVDQEFAKNIENDGWREYMIFKETGNPDHPNRMFSTGNSETLKNIPQVALIDWHKEHYSADQMHLVIYSSLPLEELKEKALTSFALISQNNNPLLDTSASLTSAKQKGHILYIKPVQDKRSVTLSWELPPHLAEDPTKSAELVAYALRRGHKHSLHEYLKQQKLINSISARVDEFGGKAHKFFQVYLDLTNEGLEKVETVILHCFEAFAGLKKVNVPVYLFHEKNKIAQANYQYQSKEDLFAYITQIADSIGEEDLASYPRDIILASEYKPEKIEEVLSYLTPDNCMVSVLSDPKKLGVETNLKEKWLGAEYAIEPISQKWFDLWANASQNLLIRVAPLNPFLPESFHLVDQGPNTPVCIAENNFGKAYYVRSGEFQSPEAVYHLHILSKELNSSPRSYVLGSLYIDHLTDTLHPTLMAASQAGLCCDFDMRKSALHLQISGYSDKAPTLLLEILKEIPPKPPTREQFAIYMSRHEKSYANGEKELAAKQAKELTDSIISSDRPTKKQRLRALQTILYEDFLEFHKNLFESTYLQALFAGNLSLKQAESSWLDIGHTLSKSPFPKEKHHQTKIIHLPEAAGPYQIFQKADVQGNAALLVIDQGSFSFEKRAVQEVLAAALKEAFFNELRTKQKTGYIAQTQAMEMEDRLFQQFLVQSNSHQPEELLFRFEHFIENFYDSFQELIPQERFETLKQSLVSSLQNRFCNLEVKAFLWDYLAFEKESDFSFLDQRIENLQKLSYQEFIKQVKAFLNRKNRKRLAILFEGKLKEPYAYEPILLPQIHELATYKTKEGSELHTALSSEDKEAFSE